MSEDRWRGRWALVTGASSGIGWALAEELAERGANLVLTARRGERLEALATTLRSRNGVRVEHVRADLEGREAPQAIFAFTKERGIAIDLLVNNAGFAAYGPFHENVLERQLGMVRVNCDAVVHLTMLYLPGMVERRRGDVLIVASTAAFQPVPYIATYAATKAFDLLLAEALAREVSPHGVRVCALCPGPTTSEFHAVAGAPRHAGPAFQSAQRVARTGLAALEAGKHSVVSGLANWLGVQAQRVVPRKIVTSAAERICRPKGED